MRWVRTPGSFSRVNLFDADDDGVSGFYAALVVAGGVLDLLLDRDFLTDPLPAGTQQCSG
jgi:hypothetical protein